MLTPSLSARKACTAALRVRWLARQVIRCVLEVACANDATAIVSNTARMARTAMSSNSENPPWQSVASELHLDVSCPVWFTVR